jgi:hypothetical protein
MGVMAAKGYLASATVQGENLYTITEPVFREKVRELIEAGSETDEVLAVFGSYLGFNPVTTPLDEQYDTIQNYLWGNVTRMRELNPFVPCRGRAGPTQLQHSGGDRQMKLAGFGLKAA